jgi:hypothetical protein
MNTFNKVFNANDWRAFFATKVSSGTNLQGLGNAYFTIWAHATNLDEPVISYILSPNCDKIDDFADAGRLLGIAEIGEFVLAIKAMFLPHEFPYDQEIRLAFVNENILNNWDGESEPFPFLEEKRLAVIAVLDATFETSMLQNSEHILAMAGKFEPLLGHKSLKKLAKRTGKKNSA